MEREAFRKDGTVEEEGTRWPEPSGGSSNLSCKSEPPSAPTNSSHATLFVTSTRTVWLLALIALLVLWGAFRADQIVLDFVRARSGGWSLWIARQISVWGDWYGVTIVGLVGWWQAKRRNSGHWKRLLIVMGICGALGGLGANIVRELSGRARPNSGAAAGWYGPFAANHPLKSAHAFQSFPSAHTGVVAGFFAPMGWVALRNRRRKCLLLCLPLSLSATALMGWSRVWAGAHHLSDVVAAAFLGWAVALAWLHYRAPELASSRA